MKTDAHALKGAAANSGLRQVLQAALELEELGRTGNVMQASDALKHLKGNY